MAFQVSQFDICSIYNQTPIALKLSPADQLKWNRLNYVLFHVTKKNLTMSFLYLKYLSFLVPTFNIPLNEMKCFLRMACSFLTSFATISQQRLFQLHICCLDQCLPNVSVLTNQSSGGLVKNSGSDSAVLGSRQDSNKLPGDAIDDTLDSKYLDTYDLSLN